MKTPDIPINEDLRLAALKSYQVMDTESDPILDDITEIIADICDVPIALVSLVDDCRQWFKSAQGLDAPETPKDIAFCAHAINGKKIFEVPDTLKDERFYNNPLVTGAPKIRFYAGMPLISEDGFALGTLCAIDTKPKVLDLRQKKYLRILANEVMGRLELLRKNRLLKEAKTLHELITETNQDYIFVKDKDYKIVQANSAFKALFPESMQDRIIGYTTVEDSSFEEAQAYLKDDKQAFEEGRVEKYESLILPDGRQRTLFTTKIRFQDNANDPYLLGVSRDVTEREKLIASLQKSNHDLEEFAYIASHDLKSPLNAVKNLLSLLEEDLEAALNDETQQLFQMIDTRINRMTKLLSDLLHYARVGREEHVAELLNLKTTALNCLELIDDPNRFEVTIADSQLELPKFPFELVLTNLVSNAIKHHDKQTGKITIDAEEYKHHYILKVADDGPGIPTEYREKVFQKFEKLKSKDEVEGSGMGLAMVLKMVHHYGGDVTIESNSSRGICFSVRWPKHT